MKNKKFCIKIRAWVWEYSDENFEKSEFEAFVTFKATLFQNNNDISFIEKSRFKKLDDIWLYVDGEFYDKDEKLLN